MSVRSTGALRLLLLVCACATGACAGPAPAAQKTAAVPDGRRLFARACSKCHSGDGTGGLPMAPNGPRPINFHDPAWQGSRTDAEVVAAIRDGRGAMPPFADVLKPEEITALMRHIRGLNSGTR